MTTMTKQIRYETDEKYSDYIKKLEINDRYEITFYPTTDIALQVYDKKNRIIYQLISMNVNYQEPWFSEVAQLEEELQEKGEQETAKLIISTLNDYFYFDLDDD